MDCSLQLDHVSIFLSFLCFIQIASFGAISMRKLSRSGVLHIASSNQRRTLELLQRGVGIIPVTEHKALYDQYRSLAEYTTMVADSRSFIVGHIPRVRRWLADVRKLRATVEAEFEKYESDSIGMILYEGLKVM